MVLTCPRYSLTASVSCALRAEFPDRTVSCSTASAVGTLRSSSIAATNAAGTASAPMGSAKNLAARVWNASIRSNALWDSRSEEHTSELQSRGHLVCRLLLEKKKQKTNNCQHRT